MDKAARYKEFVAETIARGWHDQMVYAETRAGTEIRMPIWAMDDIERKIDLSSAAGILDCGDGLWVVCDAYTGEPLEDYDPVVLTEAQAECDAHNKAHHVQPLCLPGDWLIIADPKMFVPRLPAAP